MKKLIIVLLACSSILASCTAGFEEINTNPNENTEVNPEYLFNTSVYQTLNASHGAIKKNMLNNYVQYCYGQTNQMGRYGNILTTNSSYFKNFYNYALLPLQYIEDEKGDSNGYANRILIARIWKYYVYSLVESIWGPVPMSDALKSSTTVKYDDERSIYVALLTGLKECVEGIDYQGDAYASDPVFASASGKSDLLRWVKFANSLRLRLAVRIGNADPELAKSHLDELMDDESHMMESNADNCVVCWGDNEKTRNYYYDYFIIQTENSERANAAGEAFLMHTAPYNDPRLSSFFTTCTSTRMPVDFHWAPWWGKPKTADVPVSGLLDSTNPHTSVSAMEYSVMLDSYFAANYAQTLLSYAEVELLKAEVAHLGWAATTGDARDYYIAGIRASMKQFGIADAAAIESYLNTDGIDYDTYSDIFSNPEGEKYFMDYLGISSGAIKEDEADPIYHQIIMQQYIAMFGQDLDAWTLIRRSQVLDLPPHYQPETGYGAVNAGSADVKFAYVPQRLVYPSSEVQDNAVNVKTATDEYLEGQDTMDKQLWWAKPQLQNKTLVKLVENYNK